MRLDRDTPVQLVIYDVTGRPVRTLATRSFTPGLHQIPFDARDDRGKSLPSGIYFYRLVIEGHVETRKLILSR